MTGWTPLYQQIVASSVWGAPDHVRLAWITLLAVANKNGIAMITEGGLARLAVISRENAADALKVLSSPDDDTLTQDNEGRRIERVENGWKLLNFQKYRDLAKSEAVREANKEAQAKWRAAQAAKMAEQENGNSAESVNEPAHPSEEKPPAVKPKPEISLTLEQIRLGSLFNRRESTKWSDREKAAYKAIGPILDEDFESLERYYQANLPEKNDFRRTSLLTLLNNFSGELDRARNFKEPKPW